MPDMPASGTNFTRYEGTPNIPGPWICTYVINPKTGEKTRIRGIGSVVPTNTAKEIEISQQGSLNDEPMSLSASYAYAITMRLTDLVMISGMGMVHAIASNAFNLKQGFPFDIIRKYFNPTANAGDMEQEPPNATCRASRFFRTCRHGSESESNSESDKTDITLSGKCSEEKLVEGEAFFDRNEGNTNLPVALAPPPAWITSVLGVAPTSYYQTVRASSTVPLKCSTRPAADTVGTPTDITSKVGTWGVTNNPSWMFIPHNAVGNTSSIGTFALYGILAADFIGCAYGVPSSSL